MTQLGMTALELSRHVTKVLEENPTQHDRVLSEAENKEPDPNSKSTSSQMAYSQAVATLAILSAIEANNQVISQQLNEILNKK